MGIRISWLMQTIFVALRKLGAVTVRCSADAFRPNSAVERPRSNASSTFETGHWFTRSLYLGLTVPDARPYLSSLSEPRFDLLGLSFGASRW